LGFSLLAFPGASCVSPSTESVHYVDIQYEGASEPERFFIESLFTEEKLKPLGLTLRTPGEVPSINNNKAAAGEVPADEAVPEGESITVVFQGAWTSWETAGAAVSYKPGDCSGLLPISRTCMIPAARPQDGKLNISADEAYRMALVPLRDLAPPYTALTVNGLRVDDPAYPLVLVGGIEFSLSSGDFRTGGDSTRQILKKVRALAGLVADSQEKRTAAATSLFEDRPVLYSIAAGGDMMLARGAQEILFAEGPEGILGGTAALVKGADLALVNLEGTISDRGEELKKTYTFRFDPKVVPALKNAGFDAVLLANNHALDFGLTGFFDSLSYMEKAGLHALGVGRDIAAASAPFVTGGPAGPGTARVFGFASFPPERSWDGTSAAAGPGVPGMLHAAAYGGTEELTRRIREDRTAFTIVLVHGGVEYADHPDPVTRAIYTELIEAGADLIIGSHPHVEQGFEWVKGKPVFWSLGDYVFADMEDTPGGDKGLFIVLYFEAGRLVYLEPYALKMQGPRTLIAPPSQLERFYRLTKECAER
jgi:poly-gamma-glutamate synthesis protein (capsule biosynthesis protein)